MKGNVMAYEIHFKSKACSSSKLRCDVLMIPPWASRADKVVKEQTRTHRAQRDATSANTRSP